MNDKSYISPRIRSDEAWEREIGHYLKKVRQQQNKTQEEVATAANISRSTLSLLERGESGSIKTLIQVLRVLGQIDVLGAFVYQETVSPIALARSQHKEKLRVRKSKKRTAATTKKSDW